ncbi:MAG: helix-turn-helix domain-containing protein [Erysipelotrichaceae bacterium]|nr:helix-turn-helix domain-containing protein [Erysipelotrichaceae bacterium]
MGIGTKIKEYRNKAGLTQKDLADKLNITYQAVSRWENDDAEPSFDMLKDICKILNCSTDDLFEIEKPPQDVKEKNQPQIIEKVIIKETEKKLVFGVCEQCKKPIYKAGDLFNVNESYRVSSGRTTHIESRKKILCKECNEQRILQEKRDEEYRKKQEQAAFRKTRIHSFIWPSLLAIIFLIVTIKSFVDGNTSSGIGFLVITVLSYTFLGTMILNNTFLTDMWLEVASWGFVKMPGIIFSFSFDGIIFLIAMKIFLFLLGIVLAVLAASFATALALGLSIFVYPFALVKNLKGKE